VKTELQEHPDEVDTPDPPGERALYGWIMLYGVIAAIEIIVYRWA
jgi:hypothetical protein